MQARTAAGHPLRRRALGRAVTAARVTAWLSVAIMAAGCAGGPGAKGHSGGVQTAGTVGTTVFPPGHRQPAPAVAGTTLTGGRLSLAGYRGSVVVLNFWASWCGPCKAEGPVLARLWHAYQPRGVRFLGVDVSDTRAAAAAFERRYGIGYPSLSDPTAAIELSFGRVIPPAIPDTLVLDRSGGIEARVVGQVTYPGLQRLLGQALNGAD